MKKPLLALLMAGAFLLAASHPASAHYCRLDSTNLAPEGTYSTNQSFFFAGTQFSEDGKTYTHSQIFTLRATRLDGPSSPQVIIEKQFTGNANTNFGAGSLTVDSLPAGDYHIMLECISHPCTPNEDGITQACHAPNQSFHYPDTTLTSSGGNAFYATQSGDSTEGHTVTSYTFPVHIREADVTKPSLKLLIHPFWDNSKYLKSQVLPANDNRRSLGYPNDLVPAQFILDATDIPEDASYTSTGSHWGIQRLFFIVDNEDENGRPLYMHDTSTGDLGLQPSTLACGTDNTGQSIEVTTSKTGSYNSLPFCLGPCRDGSYAVTEGFTDAVEIPIQPDPGSTVATGRVQGRFDIFHTGNPDPTGEGSLKVTYSPIYPAVGSSPYYIGLSGPARNPGPWIFHSARDRNFRLRVVAIDQACNVNAYP